MGNKNDVVVSETELKYAASTIRNKWVFLNEAINSYIKAVEYIGNEAIESPAFKKQLQNLIDTVKAYKKPLHSSMDGMAKQMEEYYGKIKETDTL